MASGGGIGAGIAYDFPETRGWKTTTEAVMTINRYWSASLTTERKTRRTQTEAYARVRDMRQLAFFGPGTNSLADDRTHFGMRDPILGIVSSVRLSPWVIAGARAEQLWPSVRSGEATRFPSLEAFEREPFIASVEGNRVKFHYKGAWLEPQLPNSITPGDVVWTCELLAQLSPRQWLDAFRAGGYPDANARRYIARLRQKVDEGLRLRSAATP